MDLSSLIMGEGKLFDILIDRVGEWSTRTANVLVSQDDKWLPFKGPYR
jgi:hypothetical protein